MPRALMLLMICAACGHSDAGPDAAVGPGFATFSFTKADNPALEHDITAVINGDTIRASTPFDTSITSLRASFVVDGAVTLDGVAQISGMTANDFTAPRTYLVTRANGEALSYTVTVRVPAFAPSASFPVGMQTYGVALGDINNDTRTDVVTANIAADTVSVLVNSVPIGATTPGFATAADFGTATGPYGVALADFNGDGTQDIAVAATFADQVSVLTNTTQPNGALMFSAPLPLVAAGGATRAVATVDLDGDLKPDLVSSSCNAGSISVFLNATAPAGAQMPQFHPRADFAAGPCPEGIAVGDLDGDSFLDLAVANFNSSSATILLGNGAGAFGAPVSFPTGLSPSQVVIADFNLDGRLDLATTNYGMPMMITRGVSVLLNTTPPGATAVSFELALELVTVDPAHGLAVGDVSGDGKPDLVAANTGSTISVFLNASTPAASSVKFSARRDLPTAQGPWAVAIGDVNNDGLPDLAVASGSDHVAAILLAR